MKLHSLTAEGLWIPDGTYALHSGGRPHDVALITGLPASGKTTFLRLVAAAKEAVAPYGSPPDFSPLIRSGEDSGRLTVTWVLSDEDARRTRGAPGERTAVIDVERGAFVVTKDPEIGPALVPLPEATTRFELFPASRRLGLEAWRFPHPPVSQAIEEGRRLGSDPDKYAALRRVFFDLSLDEAGKMARVLDGRGVALRRDQPDLLAPYKSAAAAMLPDLRLVSTQVRDGTAIPRFARRDGSELGIPDLSASEEQAALFAFAFTWLRLSRSVVLVDTPELHIHPKVHADFFGRLSRLGPDNQLLAATSSEALLRSVPVSQVIDLSSSTSRKR